MDDLLKYGSVTPEWSDLLRAMVQAHLNIVVSGGTGSGKTTFLNILSNYIPNSERIVTIEDAAELSSAKITWSGSRRARPTSKAEGRSRSATW